MGWEDLDVSATAVNVLFVLDTELLGAQKRGREKKKSMSQRAVAGRGSHVANNPAKDIGDGVAAVSELASLIQRCNIEPLWQYAARSRRTTNILRQDGASIPP